MNREEYSDVDSILINCYANYFFLWLIAGCFHLQKTSETAQVSKCVYATNGGYFGSTGACIGNLITDSKVIQVCDYGYGIHGNSMYGSTVAH